jgi:glycosyltransferase involved in cell wall biosynthesis
MGKDLNTPILGIPKMKPEISVIIPAYNEEKLIERTLSSLRNQETKVPYEIIVCNNNSVDRTVEIAKKYADKVVFEKRQGIGFARNTGFKHSVGKYLVHCDADTFFPNNFIEEVYKIFDSNLFVAFSCGSWDPYTGSLRSRIISRIYRFFQKRYSIIQEMRDTLTLMACCLCTPREVFKKVGGFTTKKNLCVDVQYSYDVEPLGKKAYFPNIDVRASARRFEKGAYKTIKHYAKRESSILQMSKNLIRKSKYQPSLDKKSSLTKKLTTILSVVYFICCFLVTVTLTIIDSILFAPIDRIINFFKRKKVIKKS